MANYASHTVSVIDTATNNVTDTVKVGIYPVEARIFRSSYKIQFHYGIKQ